MLWILAAVVAAIVIYMFARPALMKNSAWASFAAIVDRPFVWLFTKSRQIAAARLAGLAGVVVAIANSLSDVPIDWSTIGEFVIGMLPAGVQPVAQKLLVPLLIWAGGEFFRRITSKPIEVIMAPTTPATIAAEAKVEQVNAQAIATVEAAKAA